MALPLALISLLARFTIADIPNSITTPTECKTCPYNLCPNTKIYDFDNPSMNLTCWAEGTEIVGDTTWLKTNDSCYVTQYDIDEYAGDYTEDLPSCGYVEPEWTLGTGRTRYVTECYLAPYMKGTPIKFYKYNINLDLTCVAPNVNESLSTALGKTKWYKTTSNCYVHETNLERVRDERRLDDCGPIYTNLQLSDHEPEATPVPDDPPFASASTTEPSSPSATTTPLDAPTPLPSDAAVTRKSPRSPKLNRRFLYTTQIGEEYVNCTGISAYDDRFTDVKRVYEFNQTVTPQCGTTSGDNIMLFTTDFCWIKDDEVWDQLLADTLRSEHFWRCERFTDEVT